MTEVIVFSVLAIVLLSSSTFMDDKGGKITTFIWGIICIIIICLIGVFGSVDGTYKEGQIDALKGTQTHEIQCVYRLNDSIPIDTLYVEIAD